MEIYNETIRDLLGDKDSNVKHEVKLAGPHTHEVIVTNLKTITVEQENQVMLTFHLGNRIILSCVTFNLLLAISTSHLNEKNIIVFSNQDIK